MIPGSGDRSAPDLFKQPTVGGGVNGKECDQKIQVVGPCNPC